MEAECCLRELEVPHFHHEFVYEVITAAKRGLKWKVSAWLLIFFALFTLFFQAVIMVLESKGDWTLQMILQLLKSLCASTIITVDQLRWV